ncbi:MAG: GIY-YIG nuclease family protein [Rikenellaceae bacterium]
MRRSYVYIVTNKVDTVLYIGVTSNLKKRIEEHIMGRFKGFTLNYNCKKLVYFEEFSDIRDAIAREKELKNWHREWKINLIKSVNPDFLELTF